VTALRLLAALLLALAALAAQPAAAQSGGSRFQVVPGLMIDIDGTYPPGFTPGWSIVDASQPVPAKRTAYRTRNPGPHPGDYSIRLGYWDGTPALLLEGYCLARLSTGPVVLGRQPTVFELKDFRNARPDARRPGCAKMSAIQARYGGAARLAADPEGNLILDLDVTIYAADGSRSYRIEVDGYKAANRMTPLMARQALDQRDIQAAKQQQAAKAAEQELAALRSRAAAGNVAAMAELGRRHLSGRGAPPNRAEGLRWLSAAATKGDSTAAMDLGLLHHGERGYGEAARWFKAAAARGVPEAMYNLGLMAKNGEGSAPSLTAARNWMKQAAERGYNEAIVWLRAHSF
jgi:hypothetical protein